MRRRILCGFQRYLGFSWFFFLEKMKANKANNKKKPVFDGLMLSSENRENLLIVLNS